MTETFKLLITDKEVLMSEPDAYFSKMYINNFQRRTLFIWTKNYFFERLHIWIKKWLQAFEI